MKQYINWVNRVEKGADNQCFGKYVPDKERASIKLILNQLVMYGRVAKNQELDANSANKLR